jgi:hypothetical protein
MALANVIGALRWKRAKTHRGSRRRRCPAASRSRIYVSSCDHRSRSSRLLQSGGVHIRPYTNNIHVVFARPFRRPRFLAPRQQSENPVARLSLFKVNDAQRNDPQHCAMAGGPFCASRSPHDCFNIASPNEPPCGVRKRKCQSSFRATPEGHTITKLWRYHHEIAYVSPGTWSSNGADEHTGGTAWRRGCI